MALRLHEPAHHAKDGVQVVGRVRDEGGDDGVVGPFARCQDIRVARVQGEAAAAVLQNEAAVFRDYARAETTIIGARELVNWM